VEGRRNPGRASPTSLFRLGDQPVQNFAPHPGGKGLSELLFQYREKIMLVQHQ
jgi:hypothetical protein